MTLFARTIKGFVKLFPGSGKDQFRPLEVADTVTPVVEYPVRTQRMEEIFKVTASSAASTTPALTVIGPGGPLDTAPGKTGNDLDEYFECVQALVRSSTAVGAPQPFFAFLQDPAANIWPLAVWDSLTSGGLFSAGKIAPPENYVPILGAFNTGLFLSGATIAGFFTSRPVLVPPLWTLTAKHPSGSAAAAVAYTLTVELWFCRRPIAEAPLWTP